MEFPQQVQDAIDQLVAEVRAKGVPDNWRIDVLVDPYRTDEDIRRNMFRVFAIPRPPYDRVTGEGLD
jgi:hypothetical protein